MNAYANFQSKSAWRYRYACVWWEMDNNINSGNIMADDVM